MTKFHHQRRNGRHKAPKKRDRQPIGIRGMDALIAHRELAFLRNPTRERARKLAQVKWRA